MGESAPETGKTFTPLDEARVVTDKRDPFSVYVDLAKSNLRRTYSEKYPGIKLDDLTTLVETNFYGQAYKAHLADFGGAEETTAALEQMLTVNREKRV